MAQKILRTYGALDIAMACLYLFFFINVVPPYSPALRAGVAALALLMLSAGFLLLFLQRWGRILGLVVGYVLLGLTFLLVATLVASVAYLKGVYGAFGQGASYATFVGIAIVVPYFGLPGAFQLHRLYKREVREYFAR
ncbi:MAG: hypothetical protein RBU30_19895 [Polyangia bacterium]|jgi:hypothetical protein|nr:hypothetical protein [Polyangia bacterium]